MPTEDEIRGLKRELASQRARTDQNVRNDVLAQLSARGEKGGVDKPVEKRAPKKAAAAKGE